MGFEVCLALKKCVYHQDSAQFVFCIFILMSFLTLCKELDSGFSCTLMQKLILFSLQNMQRHLSSFSEVL